MLTSSQQATLYRTDAGLTYKTMHQTPKHPNTQYACMCSFVPLTCVCVCLSSCYPTQSVFFSSFFLSQMIPVVTRGYPLRRETVHCRRRTGAKGQGGGARGKRLKVRKGKCATYRSMQVHPILRHRHRRSVHPVPRVTARVVV